MTSWRLEPLRALGVWYGGGTPSKSREEYWQNGSIPWLSPKDMGLDVLTGTRDHITDAAIRGSATRLVDPGSVAVVVRSGILERTIPVSVVPFATTLNQDMKALVARPDVDPRWVAWGLRASERELLRTARKAGTTVASLEWQRLLDWTLPIPDLSEQRRIVEILEDHLSRLDAATAYLNAAGRRSTALTEAWLRWHLPVNPIASECYTITEALLSSRGGWSRSRRHLVDGTDGVPYLKMNNIQRSGSLSLDDVVHVEATPADIGRYGLEVGDVLFNSKNSGDLVGKTAVADARVAGWVYNENIMRLRFDDRLLPEFVGLWFLGPSMRAQIVNAARASTNVSAVYMHSLGGFRLWIPEKTVQAELVDEFSALQSRASEFSASSQRISARQRSLRAALLAAAFSGRLTGRSSDLDLVEELAVASGVSAP